jgi:signal transduction histidine kinase
MATSQGFVRPRLSGLERLAVTAGLTAFVLGVYALVVLAGGAALGRTDSPYLGLSVLATTVVAVLFAPVQAALERTAADRAGGAATTPYDVLRRFSDAVIANDAADELPGRMAMLLAQGTGAQWAQVWLTVSEDLTLSATWPVGAQADTSPPDIGGDPEGGDERGRRCLTVRHGSTMLGVLRLQERAGQPLTLVEVRLFRGLAAQAGLALRLVGLRTELEGRRSELQLRADELQASRERLIDAQDSERRRLERDLHDGAQQHLVALAVNLRLAQAVAPRSRQRASRLLAEQAQAAKVAIETLSSLSRGIYPQRLSEEGVVPALRTAAATSAIPVTVAGDDCGRPPAAVEAALYFCGMEAVQNAAKHSGARGIVVRLDEDGAAWRLTVADNGIGFERGTAVGARPGAGLTNMHDRLDAVGGSVAVVSLLGRGTTVTARVAKPGTAPPAVTTDVLARPVV